MGESEAAFLGAATGAVSLVLSIYAVLRSKLLNKRDLFLALHDRLSTADQLAGRRALRRVGSPDQARAMLLNEPREYDSMTSALAMFDILGLYVEKGYVKRDLVLEEWGHVLASLHQPADHVIEERGARVAASGGSGRTFEDWCWMPSLGGTGRGDHCS
ncbi:hypothetical protein DMH26_00575 [Streptomyces sp. WAC 05379]|uniref:hypothetical protein n=1 Tax=Streptomyces sp. WAC 05379 TaxID=2203207 RepID=UPI000F746D1A|nr:hypothetical protein [Streptomyces sp. WAC 05379]RSO09914.1 hypothetical protein DMH26_00575 [Streptomyces sp. WAC 05379]